MQNPDLWTSLFWLVFSIAVGIQSMRLGIGTLGNPSVGFLAFCASALLGLLSIALFVRTVLQKEEKREHIFAGKFWKKVICVLVALTIYAKILSFAGYLLSTFLLMCFLFWVARFKKWWWIPIASVMTSIVTYVVFSLWLNCQFPRGLLGF